MKKILIGSAVGVVLLIIVAVVAIGFFLDSIIKKGIETVGPPITQTTVAVDSVGLSFVGGSASLKGLKVGNPAGYKNPMAIEADLVSISLKPSSVMSDKVIIQSIRMEGPRIDVEGSPSDNNLTKILANVQSAAGGSSGTKKDGGTSKKLQVDDLVISGGKLSLTLQLLGNKTVTMAMPDVHLQNLGQGPEGITPEALTKEMITAITGNVTKVALEAVKNIGGIATDAVKNIGQGAAGGIEKAAQGVKDLFKKKSP